MRSAVWGEQDALHFMMMNLDGQSAICSLLRSFCVDGHWVLQIWLHDMQMQLKVGC